MTAPAAPPFTDDPDIRQAFAAGARGFTLAVAAVPPGRWDGPGLGDWSLRELVGHATRSLTTVEDYLAATAEGPEVRDPVAYFVAMTGDPANAERRRELAQAIAERGRQAGRALPADPAPAVAELARRVVALVEATPDDAVAGTPAGPMPLAAYLPTRTMELTVHTLDLAEAAGVAVPAELGPAVVASCGLAGRLAGRQPRADRALLALTGRGGLPPGFSVI